MTRYIRYETAGGWWQVDEHSWDDPSTPADVVLAAGVQRGWAVGPQAGPVLGAVIGERVQVGASTYTRERRWTVVGDGTQAAHWSPA